MVDGIEKAINRRRSLESALAELEAKYQRQPSPELARMMEQLKAEIDVDDDVRVVRELHLRRYAQAEVDF